MGLLGGDSKSESNAIDNRIVTDGNGITMRQSKGATINVTNAADIIVDLALNANAKITENALNTGADAMKNALAAAAEASENAIAAAQAAAAEATATANTAMDRIGLIADKSQGYAWESASDALGLTMNVIDMAFDSAKNQQNSTMATVANIADAYQMARETEVTAQFQDYRYILIAGMAVVGIVAFQAMKR